MEHYNHSYNHYSYNYRYTTTTTTTPTTTTTTTPTTTTTTTTTTNYTHTTPHHTTLHSAVVGEVTTATTPKSTNPTTFRSISGFALPSMHHKSLKLPPPALCGTTGIKHKIADTSRLLSKIQECTGSIYFRVPSKRHKKAIVEWHHWWDSLWSHLKIGFQQGPALTTVDFTDLTYTGMLTTWERVDHRPETWCLASLRA